jgi:hypothetical protein
MSSIEFVNLNGRQVAVSSLPPAIRDTIIRNANNPLTQSFEKFTPNPDSRTPNQDFRQLNERNLALLQTKLASASSPREMMKLREQAIKAGVKGSSLHLGGATPEVLAQLQKSRDQNNFLDKKQSIQKTIDQKVKEGIVLGNSSTRPNLTQQTANRTFAIQQAFTDAKSAQVRETFDSPEFQLLKQSGDSTGFGFADLLNAKGIAVPKHESLIVNELAQADIQGDFQTAQNINRILEQSGFTDKVSVTNGQLSGLESNPVLSSTQSSVNAILTGAPSILGTDLGFGNIDPTSDLRFSDLPALDKPLEEEGFNGGAGILGLLTNPFILLGIGAIILFAILAGRG